MSQFQPLPDPTNLQATIAPIDTYFRPAERNVAGAPVGPNPAREIAAAMGRFDQSLQQYYFQPAHEEMKQQQQADAQIYHSRLKNFKAFDEAVKNGTIHQGDNPWLQAFTKELFAKDAANDLSIRAAEFTDRQDILRGEYNGKKYQSADQAFAAAFADVSADVLESHGGMGDAYFRSVYSQMSGPIRDRAANQFAQGLRRHNIETAMTALEKDINNNLTDMLAGFAGADGEAKGQMVQQFAAATKALAVESNLLTKQQVNSVVGRAVLGYVESLSEDHPRTAATLLDMFDDIETSPGSFLRDSTAFNLQVTRLEEKIGDNLVKESDDEYRKYTRERTLKKNEMTAEVNKYLRHNFSMNLLGSKELEEYKNYLIDTYGEYVDSPAEYLIQRVEFLHKQKGSVTSESVKEDLADITKRLYTKGMTPDEAEQWMRGQEDLSVSDIKTLQNTIDIVRSQGETIDVSTHKRMELAIGARAEEALEAWGSPMRPDQYGNEVLGKGPEYQSKMSQARGEILDALVNLEESEEFKSLSVDGKTAAINEVVDSVFHRLMPTAQEKQQAAAERQSDRTEARFQKGDTPTSKARNRLTDLEKKRLVATSPVEIKELDEKIRVAEDIYAATSAKSYDTVTKAIMGLEERDHGRGKTGFHLRADKEDVIKALYEISMSSVNGPRHARGYLYSMYQNSLKSGKEGEVYKDLFNSIKPDQLLLVDSPEWADAEYDRYLELKKNPELLDEVEMVTVTRLGVTTEVATYPNRMNLFHQLETVYGYKGLEDKNSPMYKHLENAWRLLLDPRLE